jgi:hypothetical protein
MKPPALFVVLFILFSYTDPSTSQTNWGRLANPEFENQYIKSTFFFAGNWRNGVQFYEYNPSDNTGLYTMHPSDSRHLGWSENLAYRNFALNSMIAAGMNMINMSYWGPRGTDNWSYWAPMQTSTYAHDELFNAALDKKILVAPYIESFAATSNYGEFSFRSDFPGSASDPAPQLITLIEDLVDRYLVAPDNEQWPDVWARAYDQDGMERYIISIIHVSSDQAGVDDQIFAEGFDRVADSVFNATGIRIGFLLDALPVVTYSPGIYKITPEDADTWLATQKSILGIQCFIPEIWTGFDNDADLIAWKRDFCQRWSNTSIPFIIDVSPGYDAHVVFPGSMLYGNKPAWRDSLSAIVEDIPADGITVNTWNGYAEGFAVVPTLEYSDANFAWINGLFEMYTLPVIPDNINPAVKIINELCIHPNPVRHEVLLEYSLNSAEEITIQLLDLQGRVLETFIDNEKQVIGTHELTFSLPDALPAANYLLVISSLGGQTSIKITT